MYILAPDDRLLGLVVMVSASRAADWGSILAFHMRIFPGWVIVSNLEIGTPVATLPGTWHYRVNAGTGLPDVCIVSLGEIGLICTFHLSVAASKIVWEDPSLRYTSMLLRC